MKTVLLFAVAMLAVCLVGCEDPELVTCQQEKDVLQGQLDAANTTIEQKDDKIETLKTESAEMQTKAMEGIQVMMTKQGERDSQINQELAERDQQIQNLEKKVVSLETRIAEHVCVVEDHDEDDDGNEDDDGDNGDDD